MKLKIRHANVMRLQPGDVVVVTLDNFSHESARRCREMMMRILPDGVDVIVTSPDASMKVVRPIPSQAPGSGVQ